MALFGTEARSHAPRNAGDGLPRRTESLRRSGLLLGALLLAVAPVGARADGLPTDRIEFNMYGRMGLAWSPHGGDVIQGHSMNLTGNAVGGRLEEGDYLEPTLKMLVVKPDTDQSPYARIVLTPAMYAQKGSFLGIFSNGFQLAPTLEIELFQAYAEVGNLLLPGLKMWIGQRFYRGTDVHIADNYYFNNLTSQGAGIQYGPLDVAVLLQTGSKTDALYGFSSTGTGGIPDSTRQRTVIVAQYVQPIGGKSTIQGLGELHVLPAAKKPGQPEVKPGDLGWVLGAKAHLDFGNGNFNDLSFRYGGGIANGTLGGSQTWSTFGLTDTSGRYSEALGIEAVEHFVANISPMFAVNGYGMLHYATGASGTSADKQMDFSAGARTFLYLTDHFHLLNEAHFQARQIATNDLGTEVRLSIMPSFVPSGVRSVWARPHLRVFYTIAFYNQAAVNQLMSPYLQTFGPRSIGHYIGTRAEWWF